MKFLCAVSLVLGFLAAAAGAVDFKKDIRPILKAKCYECHSETAKKEKAGYVFDNLERFAHDIGPKGQIVPGDPERSNLVDLVTRSDKDRMPPGGKEGLNGKEIKLLREWIKAGAVLDDSKPKPPASGLAPRPPAGPPPPLQDWTNTEGKTLKARFVQLNEDSVVIKTEAGKSWKVPLNKLSTTSQEQAKQDAAAETKAAKGAAP